MLSSANRIGLSICFILAGLSAVSIGIGILPVDPGRIHAPGWLIALTGLPFLAAGAAILARPGSNLLSWAGGTITVVMTVVSAWVALYGPSEQFVSGGVPFLSRETDVWMARGMFVCISLLGLAMIVGAAWKTWGPGDDS